jgi:hypothetical protein
MIMIYHNQPITDHHHGIFRQQSYLGHEFITPLGTRVAEQALSKGGW